MELLLRSCIFLSVVLPSVGMQSRHVQQASASLQEDGQTTVAEIGKKLFPSQPFKEHRASSVFRFGASHEEDHPTAIGKGGDHPNAQYYEVEAPYLTGLVLNIFSKNSTGEGGLLMVLEVPDTCGDKVTSFVEMDRSRCSSRYPCALRLPAMAVRSSKAGQTTRFRTRVIREDEDYGTDLLEYKYLRLDYDGEVEVARESFNAKVESTVYPTMRSMTFSLDPVLAAGGLAVTPIIENKNSLTNLIMRIRQPDSNESKLHQTSLQELHGLEAELSSYRQSWASEWRVATQTLSGCSMSYFEVVADQLFPGKVMLELRLSGSGEEVLKDVLVTTRTSWAEAEVGLIETVLKDSFGLFLDQKHIIHGLPASALKRGSPRDHTHSNPTEWGYAMESWIVMAETGSITKADAAEKIKLSLSTMRTLQKDPKQFVHGLFYPYYQLKDTKTGANQFPSHTDLEEMPCGDDALLYSSLLVVQGWLKTNDLKDEEELCGQVVKTMDFSHCTRKSDCRAIRQSSAPKDVASDQFWSVPLTFNAKTLEPSRNNWDVWADEGGVVAMVVALSGAATHEQYESIVREQQRYSPCASWQGITVGHAAFFNSIFTLPTRSMVGFGTLFESPYYHEFAVRTVLPSFRAHQRLKRQLNADYIGPSDAMSMSTKRDPSKTFGSYAYFPPNNMYDCSVGKVTMENQCTWCKGIQYEGLDDPFDIIVPHGNMAAFLVSAMMERTQFSAWLEDTKKLMTDSSKVYEPGYGVEVLAPSKRTERGGKFEGAHQGRGIWESLSQGYTILSIYEGLATMHRRYELATKAGFKIKSAYKPPAYRPFSDFVNSVPGIRSRMNGLLQVARQQESTEKYCYPSDFGLVSIRDAHKRR
mmetsp:Transcript_64115/g.111829  ORF Transcript_64115/g.111829 Transcript_64115/m.111829 type:complete len:868 (+) Transcript_64115:80-2683(+)